MIPSSRSLVTLQPARQAALQAIMTVENARQRGARLSAAPHVRTFLRLLTGNSRMNTTVAQRIPGLNWDPKHRLSSLKQVEEALDALIASHGECCPLPLPVDVQAELFPEVQHSRTERRKQRSSLAFTRKMRREERAMAHHWRLRQNLLGQAVTELNSSHRRRSAAGTAGGPMSLTRVSLPLPSGTGDRDMPRWPLWTGCGMPGSRCVVSSMKSASL
ncbi:plasmid SOS inhibition protein A [Klebsiella variicola]|nr:plasmid SOS inhibition protein A [Klebsiella variicola]